MDGKVLPRDPPSSPSVTGRHRCCRPPHGVVAVVDAVRVVVSIVVVAPSHGVVAVVVIIFMIMGRVMSCQTR